MEDRLPQGAYITVPDTVMPGIAQQPHGKLLLLVLYYK